MNFNSFLRVTQIISFVAMMTVVIITAIMYFLAQDRVYTEDEYIMGEIYLIVNVAFLAMTFFVARFLKSKVFASTKNAKLSRRLLAYRVYVIINIALFESAGFMAAVFMFICGRIEFLFIALAALLLILMNFPNRMRVKSALKITDRDLIEELE